jgi:hypothetical protein
MVCLTIDNLTSYEICVVTRFLHAKSMSAAEIHRELRVAVYGQNVMSEGNIRHWCRMFKKMGDQMFTLKTEVVGHP